MSYPSCAHDIFIYQPSTIALIFPAHHIKELHIDGDILVGGLIPVHRRGKNAENQCDEIDPQPGYQYLTAMLFALKEINNSTTILPNITLGAKIYDTCRSQTIGVDRARDFIKYTLQDESRNSSKPLAGVVGAFRSDVSLAVANLLRVFDIPQVCTDFIAHTTGL